MNHLFDIKDKCVAVTVMVVAVMVAVVVNVRSHLNEHERGVEEVGHFV